MATRKKGSSKKSTKRSKITKQPTPEELEYKRERKRIQNFIRRAEKRGYFFPEDILPKIPKKITAGSVRVLKKITPKALYEKSLAVINKETGEAAQGTVLRAKERKQAAEKGKRTKEAKKRAIEAQKKQIARESITRPLEDIEDELREEYEARLEWGDEKKAKYMLESGMEELDRIRENTQSKKNQYELALKEYLKAEEEEKEQRKRMIEQQKKDGKLVSDYDAALSHLESEIDSFTPKGLWSDNLAYYKEQDRAKVAVLLGGVIAEKGRERVAEICEKHAEELITLLNEILYGSGSKEASMDGRSQVNIDLIRFASILNEGPLNSEQSETLMEYMDTNEIWN